MHCHPELVEGPFFNFLQGVSTGSTWQIRCEYNLWYSLYII